MAEHVLSVEHGETPSKRMLPIVVRRCQACYQMWADAVDQQSRREASEAYRACLAELFQILAPDLRRLVDNWLRAAPRPDISRSRDSSQLVWQEVVDVFVLNSFACIAEQLPVQPLGEDQDLHAHMLALARQNLCGKAQWSTTVV